MVQALILLWTYEDIDESYLASITFLLKVCWEADTGKFSLEKLASIYLGHVVDCSAKPEAENGGSGSWMCFSWLFPDVELHGPTKVISMCFTVAVLEYSESSVHICNLRYHIYSLVCHFISHMHSALTHLSLWAPLSTLAVFTSVFCIFVFNISLWGFFFFSLDYIDYISKWSFFPLSILLDQY